MSKQTDLVHLGRDPKAQHGVVNLPVYHASTILYPSIAAFKNRAVGERKYRGVRYGAYGTPTTFALADAVAELEGGAGGVVTSSGLAAVTMALTAFLNSGDHLLMVDSVYTPTRDFCDSVLRRLGVATTYYDPLIGEGIAKLIRSNTRVVFTESPGSLTFEVQDIPAIAAAAHQRDALILMDNTWATPLFFKPFEHGVDISIQAGTKYLSGGSDLVIGIITVSEKAVARMVDNYRYFKIGASWGGFESLVVPADPAAYRTAVPWKASGYLLRYHVGLEDPEDLISDLAEGFRRLHSHPK